MKRTTEESVFHVARRRILVVLSTAVFALMPLQAVDAAYPEQLIKIIVTFPPGGSADTVIRALEPLVTAELKQSLVIENRAGAGGNIGMAAVAAGLASVGMVLRRLTGAAKPIGSGL